jgi:hypothetical protein
MPVFLARRCADPVEVVRHDDVPAQLRWRGRWYVVDEVLDHWVLTGAWWHGAAVTGMITGDAGDAAELPAGIEDEERESWCVVARPRRGAPVVLELRVSWSTATWTVAGVGD